MLSVTSSPRLPGAAGGIVFMMWVNSSLTGRGPQAAPKLMPVRGGASLEPFRSGP